MFRRYKRSRSEIEAHSSQLEMHKVHVAGDFIGHDKTIINVNPVTMISVGRWFVYVVILAILVIGVILALSLTHQQEQPWATWTQLNEDVFGIAIAEFGVGADMRLDHSGREMSQLIYENLERELQLSGLGDRVALTKVDRVTNADEARNAGERVKADLVLWGRLTEQHIEAVVPSFTLVGDQPLKDDSALVSALNLIINGSGTIQLRQLSARAEALSRFVLGLINLNDSDEHYAEALRMFDDGIAELQSNLQRLQALAASDENNELITSVRKSLAVFYTFKGVAHAALGESDLAYQSYTVALNEYDNTYASAYVALGSYYYNLRQFSQAGTDFQKAIYFDPKKTAAHYSLGLVQYELGQYEPALESLNESIRLAEAEESDPVLAYLAMGYTQLALGNPDKAYRAFQRVTQSSRTSHDIKQAATFEMQALEQQSSATPTNTRTPSSEPTSRPTPLWTATPSPSSPAPTSLAQPLMTPTSTLALSLIRPKRDDCYKNVKEIVFEWTYTRELKDGGEFGGEYFALNIWQAGQALQSSVTWTKETKYILVIDAGLIDFVGDMLYNWNVAIVEPYANPTAANWRLVTQSVTETFMVDCPARTLLPTTTPGLPIPSTPTLMSTERPTPSDP